MATNTRWRKEREGQKCPICGGDGMIRPHKSGGIISCPWSYFHGVGEPLCKKGILRFSKEDLAKWPKK